MKIISRYDDEYYMLWHGVCIQYGIHWDRKEEKEEKEEDTENIPVDGILFFHQDDIMNGWRRIMKKNRYSRKKTQKKDFDHVRMYATLPVVQKARQYIEEWNFYEKREGREEEKSEEAEEKRELEAYLKRITSVSYDEPVSLQGGMMGIAWRNECELGSAHWMMMMGGKRVLVMKDGSAIDWMKLEENSKKKDKILDGIIIMDSFLMDTQRMEYELQFQNIQSHLGVSLYEGGNVILPVKTMGKVDELLERIFEYLESMGLTQKVTIYFISPVAKAALVYSNIWGEWMLGERRDKIYIPKEPFSHAEWIRMGRLHVFSTIYDEELTKIYREPCIVVIGDPFLKYEDVHYFINLWGNGPKNMMILTEPKIQYEEILKQWKGLKMSILTCPLDKRMKPLELEQMMKHWTPRHAILPISFQSHTLSIEEKRNSLSWTSNSMMIHFISPGQSLYIPFKSSFYPALMTSELAKNITLVKIENIFVGSISGLLTTYDDEYILASANMLDQQMLHLDRQRHLLGQMDLARFLTHLEDKGIDDLSVQKVHPDENDVQGETYHITIASLQTKLIVKPKNIVIHCTDERTRMFLISILTQNMTEI